MTHYALAFAFAVSEALAHVNILVRGGRLRVAKAAGLGARGRVKGYCLAIWPPGAILTKWMVMRTPWKRLVSPARRRT